MCPIKKKQGQKKYNWVLFPNDQMTDSIFSRAKLANRFQIPGKLLGYNPYKQLTKD